MEVSGTEFDSLWLRLFRSFDEVGRRRFAGLRAIEFGYGGIKRITDLTGLSHHTVRRGIKEVQASTELPSSDRIRSPGAGRRRAEDTAPGVTQEIEKLLEETTSGDPMKYLKWTTKSLQGLSEELKIRGYQVSPNTVSRLLRDLGYSLQGNKKNMEGGDHPDREAQFQKINETVASFLESGQPVLSIDSKKKERVGNFKNAGKTYQKRGSPAEVNVYDFPSLAIGTATPYGMYDIQRNEGMVNVGQSADTSEFAVESIRQWWYRIGQKNYPEATEILLCADGGGSNGSRNRSWKYFLQQLADETGLEISVCHYPPGTSKWNKIEHRMFSFISLNWKGQPLVDYQTIVTLIGNTTTQAGLKIEARLDPYLYEKGIKISDEEMDELAWFVDEDLSAWNYAFLPR
jgi:transposase